MDMSRIMPREDTLSSVLSAYNLRARIDTNPRLCGQWQLSTTGSGHASFHLISEGGCYLHMEDCEPLWLDAGDMLLLPHDDWHLLASEPSFEDRDNHLNLLDPSEPEPGSTQLLCGHFEFDSGRRNPILAALPDRVIVRHAESGERLARLADLMRLELSEQSAGYRPVLDRLADTLFVMTVRHYVCHYQEHPEQCLIAALADDRIRRALDALHARPEENWTVEGLAQEAAMSRTSFAARFSELVGQAPIDYLTQWRMVLAERLLRDPRASVASVMEQVGYGSEPAFRKAFKRVHGYGPGRIRRLFSRLTRAH
ncbi:MULTISPECIES: AraC family transcriptional regulator [unclassified Thioalkalivibrio]|uniref:AraC family transcriptional regulator n=1 Tax=unclassified Thioalkalivibrio TaxID=2621013 RepID=UPI00036C48CF|nr:MULTISPECIES: AraC family transcriptional regulator [unclassified Thioalkalivibrio]